MNIITPGRPQLCAWFIIMCYVYCEHHYDERVRGYEYLHNYVLRNRDHFDEYLGRL